MAGANYTIFATIELLDSKDESGPHVVLLLRGAAVVVLAGVGLYLIGRHLRRGTMLSIGRTLTTIAVLWIAFAGFCFFQSDDHLGLQRALIALASLLAALLAAIGQTLRE